MRIVAVLALIPVLFVSMAGSALAQEWVNPLQFGMILNATRTFERAGGSMYSTQGYTFAVGQYESESEAIEAFEAFNVFEVNRFLAAIGITTNGTQTLSAPSVGDQRAAYVTTTSNGFSTLIVVLVIQEEDRVHVWTAYGFERMSDPVTDLFHLAEEFFGDAERDQPPATSNLPLAHQELLGYLPALNDMPSGFILGQERVVEV